MYLRQAFSSTYQETTLTSLEVIGEIPSWLTGTYISNGPAQFEIGSFQFNHWFDGFAMLKKFEFQEGHVRFQNKFLQSRQYHEAKQYKRLLTNEFGTYKNNGLIMRMLTALNNTLHGGLFYDNCNVNFTYINKTAVALTESQHMLAFDLDTLDTLGAFKFEDAIKGQLSTAHPHMDASSKALINVSIQVGQHFDYHCL